MLKRDAGNREEWKEDERRKRGEAGGGRTKDKSKMAMRTAAKGQHQVITTKPKKGKSEEATTGNDRNEKGEDLGEGSLSFGSSRTL